MDWPESAVVRYGRARIITTLDEPKIANITYASAVWPTANKALYIPVRVSSPFLLRRFLVCNGATASNNLDVGLYSSEGTRIVSTGSTAQSGTTDCQTVDVTDQVIPPGWYYLAMAMDGTAGTVFRQSTLSVSLCRTLGHAVQASAFPLPAAATFATWDVSYIPLAAMMSDNAL